MSTMTQITASAGSGKTYTLTQAFLKTLAGLRQETADRQACGADGPAADWRSVMAITFTNAAATEMQDRLLGALKATALRLTPGKDRVMTPEKAARWVDVILRDRSSLNISTIDSLLNLLLRLSAFGLGLPPDFTPVFATDEILEPLWEQYVNEVWMEGGEALERIEQYYRTRIGTGDKKSLVAGKGIVEALMDTLPLCMSGDLAGLTDPAVFQTDEGKGLLPALKKSLCEEAAVILAADGLTPAQIMALPQVAGMAEDEDDPVDPGDRAVLRCHKTSIKALEDLTGTVRRHMNTDPDPWSMAAYARLGLGKFEFKRQVFQDDCLNTTKKSCTVPKALERLHRSFTNRVRDYVCLATMYRQGLVNRSLVELTEEIFSRYEEGARKEGKILNDRIPLLVRQVLGESQGVAEALCRLGTRISHFLIDEFQDTSRPHWQALKPLVQEALARGGSYTWVGDVKQAIYGFRGGDSQLFDEVAADPDLACMLAGDPERLRLPQNWRSRAEIIAFNNALFSPLADKWICREILKAGAKTVCEKKHQCDRLPGIITDAEHPDQFIVDYVAGKMAAAYSQAAQDPCPKTGDGGRVHLIVFPIAKSGARSRDGEQDEEEEAGSERPRAVLRAVLREREEMGRPWYDMLVLVRTNSQAMQVSGMLSSHGVPVITENSLLLNEHPLIVETAALLSFLHEPEDDTAFWTFISGSILGLATDRRTEEDCARLGTGTRSMDTELLALSSGRGKEDHKPVISLAQAWRAAHPDLWELHVQPLVEAGAALSPYNLITSWYEHAGVSRRFPTAEPFLRRFIELLHTAAQSGRRALADFLEYWEKSGGTEKLPMPKDLDAVRIMTVHKAKGLEAPAVIVPWTGQARAGGSSERTFVSYLPSCSSQMVKALCHASSDYPQCALQQLRNVFESMNLSYVAFTRAREVLYVFMDDKSTVLETLLTEARTAERARLASENDKDAPKSAIPETLRWEDVKDIWPDAAEDEPAEDAQEEPCEAAAETGPQELWQPMSWLPDLKLRFSFEEESQPRDVAIEEGNFVHHCLEELARMPAEALEGDMETLVDWQIEHNARRVPFLFGGDFRERARSEILWFMGVERRHGWFNAGLPEQTLTRDGKILRLDFMTHDPAGPLVLDYKTGLADAEYQESHHRQVLAYLSCLPRSLAGAKAPIGLVVYLRARAFHLVLPGGGSWMNGRLVTREPDSHAGLITEDELDQAIAFLRRRRPQNA